MNNKDKQNHKDIVYIELPRPQRDKEGTRYSANTYRLAAWNERQTKKISQSGNMEISTEVKFPLRNKKAIDNSKAYTSSYKLIIKTIDWSKYETNVERLLNLYHYKAKLIHPKLLVTFPNGREKCDYWIILFNEILLKLRKNEQKIKTNRWRNKIKKNTTVGTVSKSNRQIVERGKIYTFTHIYTTAQFPELVQAFI